MWGVRGLGLKAQGEELVLEPGGSYGEPSHANRSHDPSVQEHGQPMKALQGGRAVAAGGGAPDPTPNLLLAPALAEPSQTLCQVSERER